MIYAPCCLFISVVSTLFTGAFIDKSAPYFPIEISRTATGPTSRWIFSIGLTASIVTLCFESPNPKKYALLCVGVVLLAWVNDEVSRFWHMMGVFLLFLGSVLAVDWRVAWSPLLCVAGLWVARILMKAIPVIFLEGTTHGIWDWRGAVDESIRIMYTGEVYHPLTLRLFEAAGVMQWIVLWLLYHIVVSPSK